jgi:hypothetical protein
VRRAAAACALLLALAVPANAQSRYSLRGAGEATLPFRADVRAMGAAEAAASPPSVTGNPANLCRAEAATFYGSYLVEWVETEERTDAGVRVRQDYTGVISNLCLIFPIGPVSLGTGFLVGRRQGGTIEQPDTTSTGQPYRQIFEAEGNLLHVPALLATRILFVEVGGGLDVLLLNAKRRWSNDFTGVEGFLTSSDQVRTSQWGIEWRGGVRVPVGRRLHVGGWVAVPSELSGTRTFENDSPDNQANRSERDVTAEVAPTLAAGFELRPFGRLRIVGDWTKELWDGVTPPDAITRYVDVDRIAGGVEWSPGRSGFRWPLRLGYRTENLHTLDAGGREVREQFATAGSGFAVGDGRGEIDWFLEYGRRGDSTESEFFESVWRFGVTLTGSEPWSKRPPPETEEDW